jgi:hypothetical protein
MIPEGFRYSEECRSIQVATQQNTILQEFQILAICQLQQSRQNTENKTILNVINNKTSINRKTTIILIDGD